MEYKYFVSYFCKTSDSFGFGNSKIVTDRKIDCFNDIKYIEKGLVKGDKELKKVTIINYQLLEEIKKEVE